NMDTDREINNTNTPTQVDGNQSQSMNESQGHEQPFQDEATKLNGNKRKLTSDVWNHFDRKTIDVAVDY
ncbi:hypothetical protein Tco_0709775, partial [Tanacetum coccineum]